MSLSGTRVTLTLVTSPPAPAPSIHETRRPCSPGRCSGLAGGAVRAGCWENALPPPWSSAASMLISVPPGRAGPLPSGSPAVGTRRARGTWPAPGISAQRKVPRVTDEEATRPEPQGTRGSVAAGRRLLPLLTVRGGPSVAPHTPQAAPTPLPAAFEQGVGLPKCVPRDRHTHVSV